MTCRSLHTSSAANLGEFASGPQAARPGPGHPGCSRCFPSPSCVLFPRRADGRVVLPNPLDLLKAGYTVKPQHGASAPKKNSTHQRLPPSTHPIARSEPPSSERQDLTPPISDEITWKYPQQSQLIQSYAQIRTMPEYKAFKLNQDGKTETRRRANTSDSALDGADQTQGQAEWMEEIRVTRRTKKQAYVRSGTHDFCIRLYRMDQKED